MTRPAKALWAAVCLFLGACPALVLTGCGGGSSNSSSATGGSFTVSSFAPVPVKGAVPTAFTITGQDFASLATPPGSLVTVRFTSTLGTPFAGGISATADVPGTIASATSITGTSPLAVVSGMVPAFVTVIFPTGLEGTSATAIAVFEGVSVDSIAPTMVPSEIPTAFTITGDGFGPVAGTATVDFFLPAGTPFLGGTAGVLTVNGTIDSSTSISGTTPVAGAIAAIAAYVRVTLPDTSTGASAAPLLTFEPPTLTSIAPTWVDAESPTALTLTGAGFSPAAGAVTVRLQALAGTPFTGGTAAFLDVPGTIVNATTITATSPVSGLSNKQDPDVLVLFPSGAQAQGMSPLVTLEVAPDAQDDAFAAIGNVQLVQGVLGGVIDANDADPDGDAITVVAFDALSVNGGDVAVAADGSFTYDPPAGFQGMDTFTYTISDSRLTDTATVTVTVTDMVWFIDNAAAPGGDGRLTAPFDTITAFEATATDGVGDTIYLYGSATSYDGDLVLLDGQRLIGGGVALAVGMVTLLPASTQPTLTHTTGTTVTLGVDNTLLGLDLGNSGGGGIQGSAVGTLTIGNASVSVTGGPGIDIGTSGTLAVTFASLSSTNSAADGISLAGVGGSFAVTGATTVTNPAGHGLDITSTAAGTNVDFDDLDVTTSGDDGLHLVGFAGTFDVAGTCTVTTAGNDAATPSADHGIDIASSSGTFTFADVDIADAAGHGVSLTSNTGGFTISGGLIDNCDEIGVSATTCSGALSLSNLTIQETGNAAVPGQAAHGVLVDDGTGNVTIDACTFKDMNDLGAGSGDDNNGIQIDCRDGGTLPSVQITDCIFMGTEVATLGTTLDHGVRIVLDNASEITDVDVTGCLCSDVQRSFVQVLMDVDDDGDACDITDLNVSMNGSSMVPVESQGDVIEVRVNGQSDLTTFAIDGNVIADHGTGLSRGYGILVVLGQFGLGTASTATASGTINDNDIDDVGDTGIDRGIELLMQEATTAIVEIDNNTVDGAAGEAVSVRCFDDSTTDITITNNVLGGTSANDTAGTGDAIWIDTSFEVTALTLCVDIQNNDSGGENYGMNRSSGAFNLLNINAGGGGTFSAAQVDAFLLTLNTGTAGSTGSGYTECTTIQTP